MKAVVAFREVLSGPEPAPAEADSLELRLEAGAKLLTVAAEELAALARGDLLRQRELAAERRELEDRIRPMDAAERDGVDGVDAEEVSGILLPVPQQVARLLAEALYQLEEREEAERRMQDRWSSLEQDALKAVHTGGRITSRRAGRYREEPRNDARLDLRF